MSNMQTIRTAPWPRSLPLLMALFCCSVGSVLAQNHGTQAVVDASVWAELEHSTQTDVLLLGKDYPQLLMADAARSKAERARRVLAELQAYQSRYLAPMSDRIEAMGLASEAYWIAGALLVRQVGAEQVAHLADLPQVERIAPAFGGSLDEPISQASDLRSRSTTAEWGLRFSGVTEVWAGGTRGAGAVIAGQDTGYDFDHPALVRQYRGRRGVDSFDHNYNWHDAIRERTPNNANDNTACLYDSPEPCDDNGHGTHTLASAAGGTDEELIGVAPEAQWIGCRNMDRGDGTQSTYLECFQWFLAPTDLNNNEPRPELAPDVIVNSWSCPLSEGCDSTVVPGYDRAVRALRAAGVFVVASAGNSGPDCGTLSTVPASLAGSFVVAAHDSLGAVANFSSRGGDGQRLPDLAAPGVAVRSAVRNGNYATLSGTSMAGPHVAGTVALMISAQPALRGEVDTLAAILRRTARVPSTIDPKTCGDSTGVQSPSHGFGLLNAAAAVAQARAWGGVVSTQEIAVPLELSLAPNPTSGELRVALPEHASSTAQLVLLDFTGRTVQRAFVDGRRTVELDLSDRAAGLYLVVLRDGAQTLAVGKAVRL